MDASEEKQAFARGIADFCSRNGTPEFSVPLAKFAEYSDAFKLDPGAFASGFDSFIKRAYSDDGRSLLRRILPWILVPAGIYGVMKAGDMWGRHAYANGNDRGPVAGPLMGLLESANGQPMRYVGRRNAKAIRSNWKLRPLTADEHELIHRTGSSAPLGD
jgi:hypothetical protein